MSADRRPRRPPTIASVAAVTIDSRELSAALVNLLRDVSNGSPTTARAVYSLRSTAWSLLRTVIQSIVWTPGGSPPRAALAVGLAACWLVWTTVAHFPEGLIGVGLVVAALYLVWEGIRRRGFGPGSCWGWPRWQPRLPPST